MVADKFVFPNDDSSDLGKESKKFLALVSSYFTDVFSKFCWNFKVYLLIQWGRHVWPSSTDSTCLPADPLAISLAFKKEQVPPLIASAGPVSLLSAALSHWRRRHFRKSENSGLHLSPKPLSYNPKECFQSLNHHPASASISSAAVFRCFFNPLVELHAQEQNFILITEFLQALLCFISDAPDTVDHQVLFFIAATDPV